MRLPEDELVPCHHCGTAITFTAVACPHCGSREPGGPHLFSTREKLRHRLEARNYHTLAMTMLACGAAGILYGSLKFGILAAIDYGLFGLVVGVPIGFAIVVTRWNSGE
jgi:hypothetical protein